jgi:hypothetical protein
MVKLLRTVLILGVVFGIGFYTGQRPDHVKEKIREVSEVVLESTIGTDRQNRLQQQILQAREGVVEGKALLLDHRFAEANEEFERALHHLDQVVEIDPRSATGRKIEALKGKVREVQQNLAEKQSLPSHLLEEIRRELQALLP